MKRIKRVKRKIVIIAGPNGAGKTTFAQEFLPQESDCTDFINADLIARGLSPFAPEKAAIQAGKIMVGEIARRIEMRQSFAFESTLAGLSYARHIPRWQKLGYHVKLVFLMLPNPEFAVARVKMRVVAGGHHVPEPIIRRRFAAGLRNFHLLYRKLVDSWVLYDNSVQPALVLEQGERK